IGWARMQSPDVNGQDAFASLQTVARYRNGGTNGRVCVPKHGNDSSMLTGSADQLMAYRHERFLNSRMLERAGRVENVRDLTIFDRQAPINWRRTYRLGVLVGLNRT